MMMRPFLRQRPSSSSLPQLKSYARGLSSTSCAASAVPTAKPAAVPIALISQIRSKRPGTPLSLARSALQATANDLPAALAWLAADAATTGAEKAERLKGREAKEGLVGVVLLQGGKAGGQGRAAMVEMSCETDFVARTNEFAELVEGVTRTLAFFASPSASTVHYSSSSSSSASASAASSSASTASAPAPATNYLTPLNLIELSAMPLLPPLSSTSSTAYSSSNDHARIETIGTAIASTVARLGENISLRRAVSFAFDEPSEASNAAKGALGNERMLASTYLHAAKVGTPGSAFQSGSLASLVLFRLSSIPASTSGEIEGLSAITRALARQVVAVPTSSVHASASAAPLEEGEPSTALYDQPLITLSSSTSLAFENGSTVGAVLKGWNTKEGRGVLQVVEVERWEVGGDIVAEESSVQ